MNTIIIGLDIETTGLSFQQDQILEIGAIVVNAELQEIDRYHVVLPYEKSGKEDPLVLEMHEKNGLWEACKDAPPFDPVDLKAFFAQYEGAWLCGRAVKTFDQAFIEQKFPGSTAGLSHRSLDLRTLWRLEDFLPGLWDGVPTIGDGHRSISDVEGDLNALRSMIETLKHMQNWVRLQS